MSLGLSECDPGCAGLCNSRRSMMAASRPRMEVAHDGASMIPAISLLVAPSLLLVVTTAAFYLRLTFQLELARLITNPSMHVYGVYFIS